MTTQLLYNYTYPDPICMICGQLCDTTEEVSISWTGGPPYELWCYCKRCKVDTFHPIPILKPVTHKDA